MDVKAYLEKHARKLDFLFYEHLFEGASIEPFFEELSTYQNTDGGFGHALEPDLRLPGSSVLATTVAFQYLAQIATAANTNLVKDGIRYLLATYDQDANGWSNLQPEANQYPRAPWWDYEKSRHSTEWGNPSAEVLGYLMKYSELITDNQLLERLFDRALNRLCAIVDPEPHEIKCYIRLYEHAKPELQQKLYEPLGANIKKATITNPHDWLGYVTTPLTFISSPASPFAKLFDVSLLLENANHLLKQIKNNNHWEPTWSWGDQFIEDWEKAKLEWSGKITVENYQTLKAFGVL